MRISKTERKPDRRLVIILFITGVVLIAAGLYIWQSALAWTDYERRLNSEKATYEELRSQAGTGTADERLRAIRTLDDKLAQRAKLCDMNALYAWQASIVPALREGVAECEKAVKRLDALSGPLGALREYLDSAEKLKAVVGSLAPSGVLSEKNWAEQGVKKALQAQESIRKLTADDEDARRLLGQAKSLSDQLVKAWQTLLSANEAKDKAAFLGASASVAKAYADFAGLADTADTDISTKAQAVLNAAS